MQEKKRKEKTPTKQNKVMQHSTHTGWQPQQQHSQPHRSNTAQCNRAKTLAYYHNTNLPCWWETLIAATSEEGEVSERDGFTHFSLLAWGETHKHTQHIQQLVVKREVKSVCTATGHLYTYSVSQQVWLNRPLHYLCIITGPMVQHNIYAQTLDMCWKEN